jgi:hypothetical protein
MVSGISPPGPPSHWTRVELHVLASCTQRGFLCRRTVCRPEKWSFPMKTDSHRRMVLSTKLLRSVCVLTCIALTATVLVTSHAIDAQAAVNIRAGSEGMTEKELMASGGDPEGGNNQPATPAIPSIDVQLVAPTSDYVQPPTSRRFRGFLRRLLFDWKLSHRFVRARSPQ